MILTVNPATGADLESYPEMAAASAAAVVDEVFTAWREWSRALPERRAGVLGRLGELLRRDREALARLMALEMGKPLAQGRAEIEKCAWVCDYYAGAGPGMLREEVVVTEARRSVVVCEPQGVVLAVMPWNFPFWQVFRCAIPALMAGNTVVLKHASSVTGSSIAVERLMAEAADGQALFRSVVLRGGAVLDLLSHRAICGVAFTGSGPAGAQVAARAGACLKKSVMELGGSDPYVILEDADLDLAAEACAVSRMINGGQSCIAAKRFIVMESVVRRFEEMLVERMRGYSPGDPLNEATRLGPLARAELRDELHRQVLETLHQGAVLRMGGEIPPGPGAFYSATVMTGVRPGMKAFEEETFGPVAAVGTVRDEIEAVEWANRTSFGLGAAVFTQDVGRGERLARRIEAGNCFVNAYVRSDPRLPFGGIRDSGYGRELGIHGLREFVNLKTIYVA